VIKELLISKHHSLRPWSSHVVCSKGHKTTVSPRAANDPTVCSTCQEDIHTEVEDLLLSRRNSPLPWKSYVCCSKDHKTMVSREAVAGPVTWPVPMTAAVAMVVPLKGRDDV
jgi:hypothetical protein